MATINVVQGGFEIAVVRFHPALAEACRDMKRSPKLVLEAAVLEVNNFLADNDGVKGVCKETGGSGSVSWKSTTKATTCTVKGSSGKSFKMPATAAATLLALNERLDAVAEMLCAVDEVKLPAGIREWIRDTIPADAEKPATQPAPAN
jgi:hypothetical protein